MHGAIVLAGGPSRRLGRPKALAEVRGVPLVVRVLESASDVADDVVVVSRGELARKLEKALPAVRVVRDRSRVQSPLVGIVAGASDLTGELVAALACDLPFLRPALLRRLFAAAKGRDAAVPRWADGRIEPLVAVYARRPLLRAARAALAAGERSNHSMIARLRDVRLVDVDRLRPVDPNLTSFLNVNTAEDLRRARRMATRLHQSPSGGPSS